MSIECQLKKKLIHVICDALSTKMKQLRSKRIEVFSKESYRWQNLLHFLFLHCLSDYTYTSEYDTLFQGAESFKRPLKKHQNIDVTDITL